MKQLIFNSATVLLKKLTQLREKNNFMENNYFYLPYFKYKNSFIHGKIKDINGERMLLLSLSQTLKGDIVEIGSWEGKSTSFLAKSIEMSNNGKVYAIDHFIIPEHLKHKKKFKRDLKKNFQDNMKKLTLDKHITLLNMPSSKAIIKLKEQDVKIRFLFIDGLHTYEGVKEDFENYFPLVIKGGLIVFDDFSDWHPGVKKLISEAIKKNNFESYFYYESTFIIKV
jgi:predicted O-methyltransferase YrrM